MRRSLDHSGKHKFRGRLPCGTAVLSAAEVAPGYRVLDMATGTGEGQGATFAIRVERAAIHERRDVGRQRASLKAQAYDSRDGAGMPQDSDGTFGVATTRTAPTTLLRSSSKCFLRREAQPWLYYRHEHRPSHRRDSGAGRGTCGSHDALAPSRWPRPDRT